MSIIAGSYDDMQGGICYGGIAHAGPPRIQQAMWFDNSAVWRTHTPELERLAFSANISGWVASGNNYGLFMGYCSDYNGWLLCMDGTTPGNIMLIGGDGIRWSATELSLLETGAHTFWVTYNGTTLSGYMHGVLTWSQTVAIAYNATCKLVTGRHYSITNYGHVVGCLQHLRYYNRVLSTAEMAAAVAPTDGLLLHWVGDGIGLNNWQDVSGSGLHATNIINNTTLAYVRQGDGKISVNGKIKNP